MIAVTPLAMLNSPNSSAMVTAPAAGRSTTIAPNAIESSPVTMNMARVPALSEHMEKIAALAKERTDKLFGHLAIGPVLGADRPRTPGNLHDLWAGADQ